MAGFEFQRALPEVDALHYAPRVRIPVLMLNGKYDFFFPYETAQLPYLELLGTPDEHASMVGGRPYSHIVIVWPTPHALGPTSGGCGV